MHQFGLLSNFDRVIFGRLMSHRKPKLIVTFTQTKLPPSHGSTDSWCREKRANKRRKRAKRKTTGTSGFVLIIQYYTTGTAVTTVVDQNRGRGLCVRLVNSLTDALRWQGPEHPRRPAPSPSAVVFRSPQSPARPTIGPCWGWGPRQHIKMRSRSDWSFRVASSKNCFTTYCSPVRQRVGLRCDTLSYCSRFSNPNKDKEISPLAKEVTLKCPLCGRIAPLDVRDYMMRHHRIPKKLDPPKSTWRDRPMRDVYFERRWARKSRALSLSMLVRILTMITEVTKW